MVKKIGVATRKVHLPTAAVLKPGRMGGRFLTARPKKLVPMQPAVIIKPAPTRTRVFVRQRRAVQQRLSNLFSFVFGTLLGTAAGAAISSARKK